MSNLKIISGKYGEKVLLLKFSLRENTCSRPFVKKVCMKSK